MSDGKVFDYEKVGIAVVRNDRQKFGGRPVLTISCSTPGCEKVHRKTIVGEFCPPDAYFAMAKRAGWSVNPGRKEFFCAYHTKARGRLTRTWHTEAETMLGPMPVETFVSEVKRIMQGRGSTEAGRVTLALTVHAFQAEKATDVKPEDRRKFLTMLKAKLEEAATKAEPPQSPTLEQRRAIFREIDENYVVNRYVDGVSDVTIGAKMHLPWAWVAEIRENNFGPAGPDTELVKALERLTEIDARRKKLDEGIERLLSESDVLSKDLAAVQARIMEHMK